MAATTGGFHVSFVGVAVGATPSALTARERALDAFEGDDSDALLDGLVADMRSPAELGGTVLLPSVSFRAGRVGGSAGAFVHTTAPDAVGRDGAAGDSVLAFMQADGIGAATLSARLPESAAGTFTIGAGARYVRRYATAYDLVPDGLDVLGDPAIVEGSTVAVDLGAHWATPVAGLDAAVAVYDLGGGMAYEPSDFFDLFDTGDSSEARRIGRAFDGRDGTPSFRVRRGVPARAVEPGAGGGLRRRLRQRVHDVVLAVRCWGTSGWAPRPRWPAA